MKVRLLEIWQQLRTSFWFVPAAMALGAALLSWVTLTVDESVSTADLERFRWVFSGGADGARALLTTVAGSMVTVTGVTFSITIVAFTVASSQCSPRVLRNFMRDPGNQFVLGTFISTFLYCLLTLRRVVVEEGQPGFVPHLSVSCAFLLTILSVAVLIYYIHHASALIQVQTIVAAISRDLDAAIRRPFPEDIGREVRGAAVAPELLRAGTKICSLRSDYVEAVDGESLLRVAAERGVILQLIARPGDFIVEGDLLATASPAGRLTPADAELVQAAFYFADQRTETQDPEFVVGQLVEIAVRALSPALNDPFTAISCIDRLGAALSCAVSREDPSRFRCDESGAVRIVAHAFDTRGMIRAAFNPIRQSGAAHPGVLIRMLKALSSIAARARSSEVREVLREQVEMVERASHAFTEVLDRQDVEERYRAVLNTLER